MRYNIFIYFCLLILPLGVFANNEDNKTDNKDERDSSATAIATRVSTIDTTPISFKIRAVVDSYKIARAINIPTFPDAYQVDFDTVKIREGEIFTDIVPHYSDSVIAKRLEALNIKTELDLSTNKYVLQAIKHYSTIGRNVPKAALGRSPYYYPLFEEIFSNADIPDEVKHLAIIESGLKPFAVSRSGATGLWQFMYGTGKYLDMKISYYIDERRDVVASTKKAAEYLNKLHDSFSDWLIAIAAYNCGPGTMRKAIRKSGYKTTFWEVRPYLPPETRNYVPALLAMTYCMNYPEEHHFTPTEPIRYHCDINNYSVDYVNVKEQLSFETISNLIDVPVQQLAFLNPGLKKHIIPFTKNGYDLKIPCTKTPLFNALRDSMMKLEVDRVAQLGIEYTYDKDRTYYKVRSGDNLSLIAKRHDCSVRELMKWNNLSNHNIRAGARLVVYKGVDLPSYAQKQAIATTHTRVNSKGVVYYTIESGDTLWAISKKFPGSTIDSLKRDNKIYNSHNLVPGTVIKVTASL